MIAQNVGQVDYADVKMYEGDVWNNDLANHEFGNVEKHGSLSCIYRRVRGTSDFALTAWESDSIWNSISRYRNVAAVVTQPTQPVYHDGVKYSICSQPSDIAELIIAMGGIPDDIEYVLSIYLSGRYGREWVEDIPCNCSNWTFLYDATEAFPSKYELWEIARPVIGIERVGHIGELGFNGDYSQLDIDFLAKMTLSDAAAEAMHELWLYRNGRVEINPSEPLDTWHASNAVNVLAAGRMHIEPSQLSSMSRVIRLAARRLAGKIPDCHHAILERSREVNGIVSVWKEYARQQAEKGVSVYDDYKMLSLDTSVGLAERFGIDSSIDAVLDGVPVDVVTA